MLEMSERGKRNRGQFSVRSLERTTPSLVVRFEDSYNSINPRGKSTTRVNLARVEGDGPRSQCPHLSATMLFSPSTYHLRFQRCLHLRSVPLQPSQLPSHPPSPPKSQQSLVSCPIALRLRPTLTHERQYRDGRFIPGTTRLWSRRRSVSEPNWTTSRSE
jgi:hypothetical protein